MGCFFSTSFCRYPFLDNYLHLRIKSLENLRVKGDYFSLKKRGGDLYFRISYRGNVQCTNIKKVSKSNCLFNESLILKKSKPSSDKCVKIELVDFDSITNDDVLGVCNIQCSDKLNNHIGEKSYRLIGNDGLVVGILKIDQLHFIKQKINIYDGPFKYCCCAFCCQNIE